MRGSASAEDSVRRISEFTIPHRPTSENASPHQWLKTLEFLLPDVGQVMPRLYDREFRRLGVTSSQAFSLVHLATHRSLTQSELAKLIGLGRAATGTLLDQMENLGYIRREKDPNDRRVRIVTLDEGGRQLIEQFQPIARSIGMKVREGTTVAERRLLLSVLQRLEHNIISIEKTDPASASVSDEEDDVDGTEGPLTWNRSIEFRLPTVGRMMQRLYSDAFAELGITRQKAFALVFLTVYGDLIQSDLAALLGLGKVATGTLLKRMEADGLVSRRSSESDGRMRIVTVSDTGSAAVAEFSRIGEKLGHQIRDGITAAERHLVGDVLSRMRANISEML